MMTQLDFTLLFDLGLATYIASTGVRSEMFEQQWSEPLGRGLQGGLVHVFDDLQAIGSRDPLRVRVDRSARDVLGARRPDEECRHENRVESLPRP